MARLSSLGAYRLEVISASPSWMKLGITATANCHVALLARLSLWQHLKYLYDV